MSNDPAFLFYDGDAARDVSHMNRLERGCYFDLIQAQRKFGKLSEEIIQKVLGKDFKACWDSVKICMTYVDHMYFIEWLQNSIEHRKTYSESRRSNRLSRKSTHMSDISKSYVGHMEEENENENKDVLSVDVKPKNEEESVFEIFRKSYPGTKRGFKTEFANLCKKHKDWRVILPKLAEALTLQAAWRVRAIGAGVFVPEWKHLKTWIDQRCWETEASVVVPAAPAKKPITFGRREVTDAEIAEQMERVNLS